MKVKFRCAATTQATVREWVAAHLMAHSRYRKGTFPIHFLETQPRVFALDTEYAAHIRCHSSLWEGAVRALELEEEEAHREEAAVGPEPEETSEFDLEGRPDDVETEEEPEAEEAWTRALQEEPTVPEQEAEYLDPCLAAGEVLEGVFGRVSELGRLSGEMERVGRQFESAPATEADIAVSHEEPEAFDSSDFTAALRAMIPAPARGLLSSLGGHAQAYAEALLLTMVRADVEAAGISLKGVDLLPMRLHDNNADFMSIDFLAWTNSSRRIYLNIPKFIDVFTGAKAGEGLPQTRATAVVVVRHEINHVTQFLGNGNRPPATFREMMIFEERAYGGDVTWLRAAIVKTFLLNAIGTTQTILDGLVANFKTTRDRFHTWNIDERLNAEDNRLQAMKDAGYLPQAVHENEDYKIADLYRTKAPS